MVESVSGIQQNLAKSDFQADKIRKVSQALEANFLAEMLKSAKFGETSETMGGGIGEEQFASYMRQAQADAMAEAGGIGLADVIFESIVRMQEGK